jgi:hypothetical protein
MFATLLFTLVAVSPPWATRTILPVNEHDVGLQELLDDGEVVLVKEQAASSFRGLMLTRTQEPCRSLETRMMDVRGYPSIWKKIKKVEVIEQTEREVHYAVYVDVFLSPRLEARIKNPEQGKVVYYNDVTPSIFTWNLEPRDENCMLFYEMYHPDGVRSDFVSLVNKLEPSINDAGEVAAALVSARGYATPEKKGQRVLRPRAAATFDELSGAGTALRVIRRDKNVPIYVARRRVPVTLDVALARVRTKPAYATHIDVVSAVESKDKETTWHLSSFGGRVKFQTRFEERRLENGSVVVEESVIGGDIKSGQWTWTLTPVPGGTAIELSVDLDVTRGSRVLTTLANQDQLIRDSTGLQLVYEFMRLAAPEKALPLSDAVVAGRGLTLPARGAN